MLNAVGAKSGVETATLDTEIDLPGFRRRSRDLLSRQIAPDQVVWQTRDGPIQDLFADTASNTAASDSASSVAINVPAEFLTLCQSVILHRDPSRFALLYRLFWRLIHTPALRNDPLDEDWITARDMAQSVRRDMHKMKAFVRFRTVRAASGESSHVAWFEPEHHIVEGTAPFFARRFTQMRWAILTPQCSVQWHPSSADAGTLEIGPGANKTDAPPADAGEALWLTYYQHIFNPARLKLKMMQQEMPKRYWENLPEAQLISQLSANAAERQQNMMDLAPTTPDRRIPIFTPGADAKQRAEDAIAARQFLDTAGREAKPLDLRSLDAAVQACRACPIGQFATQAVCGEGAKNARVMVVAEQPGDQEDLRGRPLIGPSGQLFDRALAELQWDRSNLFITNAVKHFKYEPRGKRRMHKTPSQREADTCLQWLDHEIALVKPDVCIALGATAATSLLGRKVAVTSERGQWLVRADGLRVMVTLHPAALLRMPPLQQVAAYAAWLADLALVGPFASAS